MIIRRWYSNDKMEEIVRIDNSPYPESFVCTWDE